MQQLILKVKDKRKMPFLKQLLKQMDFVEIVKPSKKLTAREADILQGIDESVEQVRLHLDGKIKLRSIQELLDEL